MFFTRLPLWKIYCPEQEAFKHVVEFWPLVGWITGGTMALAFALGIQFLTLPIVAVLVIVARILMTGALHEDGLADYCDGMGGGKDKERILQIMKDSHIGTYGVIGLIAYFAIMYFGMREMTVQFLSESLQSTACKNPILMVCAFLITIDVWAKACASMLVMQLPYARTEQDAKNKLTYSPIAWGWQLTRAIIACLPVAGLWWWIGILPHPAIFLTPIVAECLLAWQMKRSINGYTGDCCGATVLICELTMLITWLAA